MQIGDLSCVGESEETMIKTNDLNEYVLLSVLKNYCEATIRNCSGCKIKAICDNGLGSKAFEDLDIKYEPDDGTYKNADSRI